MIIEIKPVNLEKQKMVSVKEAFLELNNDHVRYRMCFVAAEPKNKEDEAMGWEEKQNSFDVYAKRDNITAVEQWKCTNIDRWKIIISVDGMADDLLIYFRTEVACGAVFTKLINYVFNGNQDQNPGA